MNNKTIFLAILLSTIICLKPICQTTTVSLIIFSHDRPLQLHALLDSIEKHTSSLQQIFIIYRTSTEEYAQTYNECFANFKGLNISLKKQGSNPQHDFKQLVMSSLHENACPYVAFAVDDNIVKDYIDFNECIKYLNQTNAYGFYLRLGTNITYSYNSKRPIPVPHYDIIDNHIMSWNFKGWLNDWGYPNTVDMTIYKTGDIINRLQQLNFTSPNSMESAWHRSAKDNGDFEKRGICFLQSKIFNIPFNQVQHDYPQVPHMHLDKDAFLQLYKAGHRINIEKYYKINNASCHYESPLYLQP